MNTIYDSFLNYSKNKTLFKESSETINNISVLIYCDLYLVQSIISKQLSTKIVSKFRLVIQRVNRFYIK